MSREKLQTMSMQNFWGIKEVHYGIVQVVGSRFDLHKNKRARFYINFNPLFYQATSGLLHGIYKLSCALLHVQESRSMPLFLSTL